LVEVEVVLGVVGVGVLLGLVAVGGHGVFVGGWVSVWWCLWAGFDCELTAGWNWAKMKVGNRESKEMPARLVDSRIVDQRWVFGKMSVVVLLRWTRSPQPDRGSWPLKLPNFVHEWTLYINS
jgi:hypothetical protein